MTGVATQSLVQADQRRLLTFWDRLRAGRPCPDEDDLLASERDFAADYLFHLDRTADGRHIVRTAGSLLAAALARRGTSKLATLVAAPGRPVLYALIEEVLATPSIAHAVLATRGGAKWELSLLPVRAADGTVRSMIGSLNPQPGTGTDVLDGSELVLREQTIDVISLNWVTRRAAAGRGTAQSVAPIFELPEIDADECPARPRLSVIEGGGVPPGTTLVHRTRPAPKLRLV